MSWKEFLFGKKTTLPSPEPDAPPAEIRLRASIEMREITEEERAAELHFASEAYALVTRHIGLSDLD